MKKLFAYLMLCMICMSLYGQKATSRIKNLSIGDKVPDILLGKSEINNKKKSLRISDFRGKLVILDFWASYCVGCIEAFPRLDSLQKQFGKRIKIILVNESPKKYFDEYMAMRKKKHQQYYTIPSLLSINDDKVLSAMFRHNSIPHDVWIDPVGKVIAITQGYDVTAYNIDKKLKDPDYTLDEKIDWIDIDHSKPILQQILTTTNAPLKYYSAVLKYNDRTVAGGAEYYVIDSVANTIRVTRTSTYLLQLFGGALTHWIDGFNYPYYCNYFDYGKRVILEVVDSSKYIRPVKLTESWKKENWFGYEAVRPLEQLDSIDAHTLSDLNHFFGLNVRMEKREMKTMALIRISGKEKFKSKQDKAADLKEDTTLHFRCYDVNMLWLRNTLAETYKDTPLIFWDNTDYKGYIDIELHSNLHNLSSVRKELQLKYDLDIIEKIQPVDVMVVTEKNYVRVP